MTLQIGMSDAWIGVIGTLVGTVLGFALHWLKDWLHAKATRTKLELRSNGARLLAIELGEQPSDSEGVAWYGVKVFNIGNHLARDVRLYLNCLSQRNHGMVEFVPVLEQTFQIGRAGVDKKQAFLGLDVPKGRSVLFHVATIRNSNRDTPCLNVKEHTLDGSAHKYAADEHQFDLLVTCENADNVTKKLILSGRQEMR